MFACRNSWRFLTPLELDMTDLFVALFLKWPNPRTICPVICPNSHCQMVLFPFDQFSFQQWFMRQTNDCSVTLPQWIEVLFEGAFLFSWYKQPPYSFGQIRFHDNTVFNETDIARIRSWCLSYCINSYYNDTKIQHLVKAEKAWNASS